jgi:integrase
VGAKTEVKGRKRGDSPLEPPSGYESEISHFLAWVQLERGLSKNTIESYESDLIQCAIFFKEKGAGNWQAVSLDQVSTWISSLTLDGYAVASLARKLSALRMLARYLVSEGNLQSDFTELLSNPKKGRFLPHALSIEEMEKFLNAPDLKHRTGKERPCNFRIDVRKRFEGFRGLFCSCKCDRSGRWFRSNLWQGGKRTNRTCWWTGGLSRS